VGLRIQLAIVFDHLHLHFSFHLHLHYNLHYSGYDLLLKNNLM
jgi:hypothetical protein